MEEPILAQDAENRSHDENSEDWSEIEELAEQIIDRYWDEGLDREHMRSVAYAAAQTAIERHNFSADKLNGINGNKGLISNYIEYGVYKASLFGGDKFIFPRNLNLESMLDGRGRLDFSRVIERERPFEEKLLEKEEKEEKEEEYFEIITKKRKRLHIVKNIEI